MKHFFLHLILAAACLAALPAGAAQIVNINTADKATLMAITGVGERRAEAIIAYREQHGPFQSVDQLTDVQGVGQAIVESNREILRTSDQE